MIPATTVATACSTHEGPPQVHVLGTFFCEKGSHRGLGPIYASVKVSREPDGPSRDVRLLVDTGATASIIPREVLLAVGIPVLRTEEFEFADGRKISRQIGGAYLTFSDHTGPTLVVFGEPDDTPVLGVIELEEMGLEIDSRSGEVRKAKRLLVGLRGVAAAMAA